jgi:hypothetical protein
MTPDEIARLALARMKRAKRGNTAITWAQVMNPDFKLHTAIAPCDPEKVVHWHDLINTTLPTGLDAVTLDADPDNPFA